MAIEDVVINATAKQIEDMATKHITHEISEDSTQDELPSAAAVYGFVTQNNGGNGGGGSIAPLIVTEEDDFKASHNFGEISRHVFAGGDVFFDSSIGYIALNDLSHVEGLAIFAKVGSGGVNIFMVDSDGNLDTLITKWATADQIGDISSALDELNAYAQGLIAGGATE